MSLQERSSAMDVLEIEQGLWRWTAPHPLWTAEKGKPGGWGQMVGCVYYDPAHRGKDLPTVASPATAGPAKTIVLIDPLAPPEGTPEAARFWAALDADIERAGAPVAILIGNEYHSRSAQSIYERYA